MKRVFAWLTVCLLAGCGGEKRGVTSDTLYVPRIAGMTEAFILGMDASTVPSLKAGGVRYYDFDGREKDDFEILSENGISYIRVRVWVDPYDGSGRGYGGGNCDIGTALAAVLSQIAEAFGKKVMVAETSYAYTPEDAGKYYGGSAVDNQALFDSTGRALESLKVFSFLRTGTH